MSSAQSINLYFGANIFLYNVLFLSRTRFSYFAPGLPCSVCQFSICKLCTAAPSPGYPGTVQSLPASPTPPSPSSPQSPGSSISTRLGTLFRRRSSVSGVTRPRPGVMCRPCSQFVTQVKNVVFGKLSQFFGLLDGSYVRGRGRDGQN